MAGDWTPLRDNIHDDPDVYAIASALRVKDSDLVVGKLTRFWAWASQHTEDGSLAGVTREMVDRIAKLKGFAEAILAVGWLVEEEGVLKIPRFDRWMSRGAKARLGEAKRKQISRKGGGKVPDESGQMSGQKRDHRTGQDRTEQKEPSLSVPTPVVATTPQATATAAERFVADRQTRTGDTPPGFAAFFAEYPAGHATDRGGLLVLWRNLGLEDDAAAVLAGLAAWKASERWREGYVVKARKFLDERHWETAPPAPKSKPQALGGAW